VLRLTARICLSLTFLVACAAALAQADFSADIVNLSATSNTFHTRIFSTKDKLRFQGEDKSGRPNSIMIVNLAAGTSVVLIPQQKQYVESKRAQIPGQGVTFFQATDVEDACGDWQKMAHTEKGKCRKVGHEAVNGRDAVKYEGTSAKGEASSVWIDAKLHFPVKWKGAVATGELRGIKEGPQPAEQFEVPTGYAKRTFSSPAKPATSQK
jgi:hypothetical protein